MNYNDNISKKNIVDNIKENNSAFIYWIIAGDDMDNNSACNSKKSLSELKILQNTILKQVLISVYQSFKRVKLFKFKANLTC